MVLEYALGFAGPRIVATFLTTVVFWDTSFMTMVQARQLRLLLPLSHPETSLRNQRLFQATVYDSSTRGFQRRDHCQSVRRFATAVSRLRQNHGRALRLK